MCSRRSRVVTGVVLLVSLLLASCASLYVDREDSCEGADCGHGAKVCTKPTMMALACDLDHLEDHIEKYGSAIIKVPDVWGQARLTKYREEFEKVMEPEKDAFNESLQGRLSRDDQAC